MASVAHFTPAVSLILELSLTNADILCTIPAPFPLKTPSIAGVRHVSRTKAVIFLGMLAIACMVAYPPYTGVQPLSGDNVRQFMGYAPFLHPPGPAEVHEFLLDKRAVSENLIESYRRRCSAYIDTRRLTIQVSLCLLMVIGGVLLQARSPSRNAVG